MEEETLSACVWWPISLRPWPRNPQIPQILWADGQQSTCRTRWPSHLRRRLRRSSFKEGRATLQCRVRRCEPTPSTRKGGLLRCRGSSRRQSSKLAARRANEFGHRERDCFWVYGLARERGRRALVELSAQPRANRQWSS